MNPYWLIKSEFRCSLNAILGVALVLALATSLGVGVSMSERAIRKGMARAGDDFDLLIGARGSAIQLVLGTVYLRPETLRLTPAALKDQLAAEAEVRWVAPLAFGDRWKTFPLVGTTPELVLRGGTRSLTEGRAFSAPDEAVVGSAVPLALGTSFTPLHGQVMLPEGEKPHNESRYTVVGRLPAMGTPWDRAILVPIASVWAAHEPKTGERDSGLSGYSALVVKPVSIAAAYRLRAAWNTSETQAVFTGEVLAELFATLGDARDVMQYMALSAEGVALGAALLAGFFAIALRRGRLALLRALGAPGRYILVTVWLLASLTMTLGGGMGLLLGWGLSAAVAKAIIAHTGIMLPVLPDWTEYRLVLQIILAGSLSALLPAFAACGRTAGQALRA